MRTKFAYFLTFVFALLVPLAFAQAQTMQISGTVTDEDGVPIPGVNITVEGTTAGTSSDFNGDYTLSAEQGQVLKFESVGFKDQSVTVGAEATINVQLEMGTALDEIIVTAFGRKLTRNESTASVVTVSSDEITKAPYADAVQGLQGKVPGVNITQSTGVPGSQPNIRIRGMSSITASNSPLYVIDGVPVKSGNLSVDTDSYSSMSLFALVDPNDIEQISVLKDASAVAPYGADGANGVILVTTKSGKKGKAQYSLNYTVGVQNPAVSGLTMMNAQQRYEALTEATWNSFGSSSFGSGNYDSREGTDDFLLNGLGIEDVQHWKDLGEPNIDWKEELRNKNALTNQVNFSVSQGGDVSTLYASIGMNQTEGTVIGSKFKRVNGSIKYGTQLNDDMNLNLSASVSNARQEGLLEEAAYFGNPNLSKYFISPWVSPYNDDGSLNIDDFSTWAGGLHNTVYTQKHNLVQNDVTRGIVNANYDFEIIDNLVFRSVLGLDYTVDYTKIYQNPNHGDGENSNGSGDEISNRFYSYTTQNSLDYRFTLGEMHNFDIMALQEFTKYKSSGLEGYGENFPDDILTNLSATSNAEQAFSTFTDQMGMRYVGLLNYNYDERYLLNASYSYQGDSRFSEQFGNFFSVGLGWNLQEENFLAHSDVIDVLRLKLGYGQTGNAGISRNAYQALLSVNKYNGNPALNLSGYGTSATWEKSNRADVGIDFALFDTRLTGGVTYYHNVTDDMLFNVPLPPSSTYAPAIDEGRVLRNVGKMTNSGIEVELAGDLIRTSDFTWNLGFNVATVKNMVNRVPEESETITSTYVVQEGHTAYEWRLKEWAGVNAETGLPEWYLDRTESDEKTSNYAEAASNYIGKSRIPKYTGAINTRFNYKGLFLEGQLYFSGGNKVYEDWATYTEGTGQNSLLAFNGSLQTFNGAWREPGDADAIAPRYDLTDSAVDNFTSASTRWLHDGDYMRLRELAIGYTFDRDLISKIGLSGLTLSVRGTNLWTWTKDSLLKYDPEVRPDGFTNLSTPPIKSVLFNVNLKL